MDPLHAERSRQDFQALLDIFGGDDPFASLAAEPLASPLPAADPLPTSPPRRPATSLPPSDFQPAASSCAIASQPVTPPWHQKAAASPKPSRRKSPLTQSDARETDVSARKRAWVETMGPNKQPSQESHWAHQRTSISAEELQDLRDESAAAHSLGIGWKDRGPPGPPEDDPTATWRGQKWREGSQRWANGGGSNREWYKMYYKAKQHGDWNKMLLFLQEHGDRFVCSPTASGPKELREYLQSRPSSAASSGGAYTW